MSTDKPRFSITIDDDTLERVYDYKRKNKISTQSKAIASLVESALSDLEEEGVLQKNKKAPLYSSEALQLARDYDRLDSRGQKLLRGIADIELSIKSDTHSHNRNNIIDLFPARHYIQSASAGIGDFNDDASYETIDLIKRPPAGMSFLITVDGDSMEPTYHDGDLLFVRAQETIQVGEIGLFVIAGHLYIKEAGEEGLISHNEAYEVIYPPDDTPAKVEGKIIGVCTPDYLQ